MYRIPSIQELRAETPHHQKKKFLYVKFQEDWKKLKRRSQRSWKVHRKTKYHRFAGMTHKQVKQSLDFWMKYYTQRHLERM